MEDDQLLRLFYYINKIGMSLSIIQLSKPMIIKSEELGYSIIMFYIYNSVFLTQFIQISGDG